MTGLTLGLGLGLGNTQGKGGGAALTLPDGITRLWLASDYTTSQRKSIPNALGTGTTDGNILSMPRRGFTCSALWPWNRGNCTITDNAVAAPDGSTEASTLVTTGAQNWLLQQQSMTLPAGTYTMAASVKDISSVATQINIGRSGDVAAKNLSGDWQRFSHTFTLGSPTSVSVGLYTVGGSSEVNFAFCDVELFYGSSDLNANALTAKPLRIQNEDMIVGKWDVSTVSFSDGELSFDSLMSTLQFAAASTPDEITLLFTGKRRTATTQAWESHICRFSISGTSYDAFAFGPDVTNGPNLRLNGNAPIYGTNDGLMGGCGERFTWAIVYNETTIKFYVNGALVYSVARTTQIVELRDFFIGVLGNVGFYSSYNMSALALGEAALTDEEVLQATNYIEQGLTMPDRRLVILEGDSIQAQQTNRVGYDMSTAGFGWNYATAGAVIEPNAGNSLDERAATVDAILSAAPSGTTGILTVTIGANDLASAASTAAWLEDLADYCDARRSAGWKVVVCTVLPQDGATTHNSRRATANSTITGSWVGVHCDAVADYAGDATMGGDDSYTNFPARWADGVHPSTGIGTGSGHDILSPILAAAIDSV